MSKTNKISIGTMETSQIQQDTRGSTQHLSPAIPEGMLEFLNRVQQDLSKVSDVAVQAELRAYIDSVRAQTQSPNPKRAIIRECLMSIKAILEGAGGNALAEYIPVATALLAGCGNG